MANQFLCNVPRNRTDLLPHYARLVAMLNKYMSDIGTELVASVSLYRTRSIASKVKLPHSLKRNFGTYSGRRTSSKNSLSSASRYSLSSALHPILTDHLQNVTFLANLTKFRVVPMHIILHTFKVCLDDFSGSNVENVALLLEGCGRFLLRSEETKERFGTMVRCGLGVG